MHDLNSVLLEGKISGDIEVSGEDKNKICHFDIVSRGYERNLIEICVPVTLRGSCLVDAAIKNAVQGCRLRVVGRLRVKENNLYVDVEHIEYCPEPKRDM
jgi:hypothetical protein